jgi:predicted CoA-binding protein
MTRKPTVAVLGASTDRRKFGNKSVRAHLAQGYEVFPVNPNADVVEGLKAYATLDAVPVQQLDRISVYLPPHVGLTVLEDIGRKGAAEVWFNPGSESPEILARAEELGLPVIMACSIVDVGMRPSDFSDT